MDGATNNSESPLVPDHELLGVIGVGSYGTVWLARNIVGTYRAVKVVHRRAFQDDRPYEREFRGIRYFEPISRTHPSFVPILHIGRNDPGEYFYYVMELADDTERGINIDPQHYVAHTLSREIERRRRLPLDECIRIGMALTAGLGHLHQHRLVHRDIKPSNIIYVNGAVKFTDIGLVTDPANPGTLVGTPGYMPETDRGSASADLFSLGIVLYEMSTGKHNADFPAFPTDIGAGWDYQTMRALNAIILKACDRDPRARFQSARELFDALGRHEASTRSDAPAQASGVHPLWVPGSPPTPVEQPRLEALGGAVPLDSAFYIERSADVEFGGAVLRSDSIILVKGARQMGKTSLLARGLQQARAGGARVILTDFQELNDSDLGSLKTFYVAVAGKISDQLGIEEHLGDSWDERRSPNHNFDHYVNRCVLGKVSGRMFWGLDEVDRLFSTDFGSEVFGMFRAWHNRRALDPAGLWSRLTLAIAYATEAHLFITDLNQSPFNVGTRLVLEDFSAEQVAELNQRYGGPLRNPGELARFVALLGGQPYLTRCGLHEMSRRKLGFEAFEGTADREKGVFNDHLRRILLSLRRDPEILDEVAGVLRGQPCLRADAFYRLRSAGVLMGDSAKDAWLRCQLYANYLKRHLL